MTGCVIHSRPPSKTHRISGVTRRDLATLLGSQWSGVLEPQEFLERLYDLDALPSRDDRFETFREDIVQHTLANDDWEPNWIFGDSRLRLDADETLLRLIAETLHPEVTSVTGGALDQRVEEINRLLRADGYELTVSSRISGRPVFGWTEISPYVEPLAGEIPWRLIDKLAELLDAKLSEDQVDDLFSDCGLPGPLTGASKRAKARAGLRAISGLDTRWRVLGRLLSRIVDPPANVLDVAEVAGLTAALRNSGVGYRSGGRMTDGAGALTMDAFANINVALGEKIGEGGFGQVYRMHDPRLDMSFALKVFDPSPFQVSREAAKARFFREAAVLFKLRHEYIVRVADLAELPDGRPYLKMEFFPGPDIQKFVDARGLQDPKVSRRMVAMVAEAIEYAHSQGVVHRDLKPSNVLVAEDIGQVRVIDFGMSILIEEALHRTRLTRTGEGVGASPFTAPELVEDPKLVHPKTDIYSIGVLWYWLLVGHTPQAVRTEEALRNTGVPAHDGDVIMRCLDTSDARPTASELAELLSPQSIVGPSLRRPVRWLGSASVPSDDADAIFADMLRDEHRGSLATRASVLSPEGRRYLVEKLFEAAPSDGSAVKALLELVRDAPIDADDKAKLVADLVGKLVIRGSVGAKAALLMANPAEMHSVSSEHRRAFFVDVLSIIERDRFDEVNELTPAVVAGVNGLPAELYAKYVEVLLEQAESRSFKGAPAARTGLSSLPEEIARAGLALFDLKRLVEDGMRKPIREFVRQYKHLAGGAEQAILEDFDRLKWREFATKYEDYG